MQIVVNANLTRQPDVWFEFGLHREAIAFEFAHFARVAFEQLDAAGGAASVAAAAVKNIDAGVFDYQDEFLSLRCFSFDQTSRSFSLNFRHLSRSVYDLGVSRSSSINSVVSTGLE